MRRVVAAAIVTVGLLGCGGDTRAVSPTASAALEADVQQIRVAVAAGDLPSATLSLSDLRASHDFACAGRAQRRGDGANPR